MANIEDSPHDHLLEDDPSDSQEHAREHRRATDMRNSETRDPLELHHL